MSEERKPDRTTVIRISIDFPVGEDDRSRLGIARVLSEEEIAASIIDPVQRGLLFMVDEMLAEYRRATQVGGGQ
jgi:hypothetical protein